MTTTGSSSSSHPKAEMKKGPWTREEDQKLMAYIELHGHGSWRSLPTKAGLQRYGKSCRLRWTNYLRPDIKRGKFSPHEEKTIIRLHALMGNRWSAIAAYLPKRTDNEIKNYWNTRLKKRLTRMGIDPTTHKPKNGSGQTKQAANLSHMAQWETARLEAEARLARESKLLHNNLIFANKPYSNTTTSTTAALPPKVAEPPQFLDVLKVWQATNNNGFFSCGSSALESPVSTLNFSSANSTSPNVVGTCLHHENPVEGKAENMYGVCDVTGLLDSVLVNTMHVDSAYGGGSNYDNSGYHHHHDDNVVSNEVSVGELEDATSYWNELLNMVTDPLESPLF